MARPSSTCLDCGAPVADSRVLRCRDCYNHGRHPAAERCEVCKKALPANRRRFCSRRCYDEATNAGVRVACAQCGTPVKKAKAKFCSRQCAGRHLGHRNRDRHSDVPRMPMANLIAAIKPPEGRTAGGILRREGGVGASWDDWLEHGIPEPAADRIACRFGLQPELVWWDEYCAIWDKDVREEDMAIAFAKLREAVA